MGPATWQNGNYSPRFSSLPAKDGCIADHIEEAWRVVAPLLRGADGGDRRLPLVYEPGSWGPAAADDLLAQEGHAWKRFCGVHGDTSA